MTRKELHAHLFGPGPKGILALDGRGIRGILTLQLLMRTKNKGGTCVTGVSPVKPNRLRSTSPTDNGGLNPL